jgi:hypothetical protein
MAMELCKSHYLSCHRKPTLNLLAMHQAWPKLLKRMKNNKAAGSREDQQLVVASRIWFCLYLFEHQYVDA